MSDGFVSTLVAHVGGRVLLVDGSIVTLEGLRRTGKRGRFSRARVRFAGPLDGHLRTVPITDILQLVDVAPPATIAGEREETR